MRKELQRIQKDLKHSLSELEKLRSTCVELQSLVCRDNQWTYTGDVIFHFIDRSGTDILKNLDRLIVSLPKVRKTRKCKNLPINTFKK
jgi:hypothetical protein